MSDEYCHHVSLGEEDQADWHEISFKDSESKIIGLACLGKEIYFIEHHVHCVQMFEDIDLKNCHTLVEVLGMKDPKDMTAASFGLTSCLYILDAAIYCIWQVSIPDGNFKQLVRDSNLGLGETLSVMPHGGVMVTSLALRHLRVYSPNGNLLEIINSPLQSMQHALVLDLGPVERELLICQSATNARQVCLVSGPTQAVTKSFDGKSAADLKRGREDQSNYLAFNPSYTAVEYAGNESDDGKHCRRIFIAHKNNSGVMVLNSNWQLDYTIPVADCSRLYFDRERNLLIVASGQSIKVFAPQPQTKKPSADQRSFKQCTQTD